MLYNSAFMEFNGDSHGISDKRDMAVPEKVVYQQSPNSWHAFWREMDDKSQKFDAPFQTNPKFGGIPNKIRSTTNEPSLMQHII